jgi:hypothetical protein
MEGNNSNLHASIYIVSTLISHCKSFKEDNSELCGEFISMIEVAEDNLKKRWEDIPTTFLIPSFFAPHFKDIKKFLSHYECNNVEERIKNELAYLYEKQKNDFTNQFNKVVSSNNKLGIFGTRNN